MTDKTFITIFAILNIILWCFVVNWISKLSRQNHEHMKKVADYEQHCVDYFHETFTLMKRMSDINLNAMDSFIEQISKSAKMDLGKKDDAEKSRERVS